MTQEPKLIENEDYYLDEEGLMVFTKEYLLKRGFCCDNRCRHCPYGMGPTLNAPTEHS
jgi:hypothetical protein